MAHEEKTQVSLSLSSDAVAMFDRIARIIDREPAFVMQTALHAYLTSEGADILRDAEGLSELDRGESVDMDDMLKKARSIVDAAEYRRAPRVG